MSVYKKGDGTNGSIYQGTSLLSTSYRILWSTVPSGLTPCVDKMVGDQHCGFQCNRSTEDQTVCICQTLVKNGGTVGLYVSCL